MSRRGTVDKELARRIIDLFASGFTNGNRLAAVAGVSSQTIYNIRDGKPVREFTLAIVRRAVDAVEADPQLPIPDRPHKAAAVRLSVGQGVSLLVEDGADPTTLESILHAIRQAVRLT